MQERCCKNCLAFEDREKECRVDPPQVTVIIAPMPGSIATGGRSPGVGPIPIAAFPSIGEPGKYWCLKFTPKLAIAK